MKNKIKNTKKYVKQKSPNTSGIAKAGKNNNTKVINKKYLNNFIFIY